MYDILQKMHDFCIDKQLFFIIIFKLKHTSSLW